MEDDMAKYAPDYMSVYDGPDYALVDLTLSAATFANGAAEDTAIGTLSGAAVSDSTLSLTDSAGGKVKLVGTALKVGATASSAGTLSVTVTETNIYGTNNPHDTVFSITVT